MVKFDAAKTFLALGGGATVIAGVLASGTQFDEQRKGKSLGNLGMTVPMERSIEYVKE